MTLDLLINSSEYDSRFMDLIKALESCATSKIDCDKCALESECRQLFDSLADRVTHYHLSEAEYNRFMEHFKNLNKQACFC